MHNLLAIGPNMQTYGDAEVELVLQTPYTHTKKLLLCSLTGIKLKATEPIIIDCRSLEKKKNKRVQEADCSSSGGSGSSITENNTRPSALGSLTAAA